ncbi:MAG: Na(+)/H(+) antiporter subunit D [Methanotrichaceae archaeon]|nr:Na(+)/H(+) antiporter subunit D [Methanotrichaceae archaeon]
MIQWLHPGFILIFGAFLIPLFRGKWKQGYLLILPAAALIDVILMKMGVFGDIPISTWRLPFLEYELIFGRVDKLSFIFGLIFTLAALIVAIYALNAKSSVEHMSQYIYVGSALGVVFAGDLITLYIFWEIMAIASTLIIWHGGTDKARRAGFRYIMWHVAGGIILLAGIITYIGNTGSVDFNAFNLGSNSVYLPSLLIFIGFIINAAVPPLHAWLPDAYPESTVVGTVFLSIFTTKTAVYALARGFEGFDVLIWLGALMVVYPIFYAVLENDLRRVLCYSLINQVGFMLCGIGIGTALSVNGAISHAFGNILFEGLLFLCVGSVLYRTGPAKCTELGGLYRTMPLTTAFCFVGAASISAFPFFTGFVTKSMVIDATAGLGMAFVFLLLQLASAGVFHHAGIKVPFFAFFAEDANLNARDPPFNMLLSMGIAAVLCIFIGVYPYPLYQILPYPVVFEPYTAPHMIGQLQLLLFASLAFVVLIKSGLYPPEQRKINLDSDWPFRIAGAKFMRFVEGPLMSFAAWMDSNLKKIAADFSAYGEEKEERILIGVSVLLGLLFLASYLIIELIYGWIA